MREPPKFWKAGQLKTILLGLAMELETSRLTTRTLSRRSCADVDFYSGIILKAMGIPSSMFTVIFAMARTVGWIAHWT